MHQKFRESYPEHQGGYQVSEAWNLWHPPEFGIRSLPLTCLALVFRCNKEGSLSLLYDIQIVDTVCSPCHSSGSNSVNHGEILLVYGTYTCGAKCLRQNLFLRLIWICCAFSHKNVNATIITPICNWNFRQYQIILRYLIFHLDLLKISEILSWERVFSSLYCLEFSKKSWKDELALEYR